MKKKVLKDFLVIAKQAGAIILSIYNQDYEISIKDNQTPLTVADEKANEYIVNQLKTLYPDIAILSEESSDDLSRLDKQALFVVDPLDGTKEFIKKNGEFTVNIALVIDGESVVGVVYAPALEKLYYASQGKGAFLEFENKELNSLKVTSKFNELNVVGSKSHASIQEQTLYNKHSDAINSIFSVGSSLKGCLIAEGKADVYYRFGLTYEWDTAAMHCIAVEAGAIVKQLDHTELKYNREDTLNRKGFYIVNRKENIWL